jgi:hypothetical protein
VRVESVPEPPSHGFAQIDAGVAPDRVEESGKQGRSQNKKGADPDIPAKKKNSPQSLHKGLYKSRSVNRRIPDYRVNGKTYYLRV